VVVLVIHLRPEMVAQAVEGLVATLALDQMALLILAAAVVVVVKIQPQVMAVQVLLF
jgi:hypothetical protein